MKNEFDNEINEEEIIKEANRCLNCKIPKCMEGCPLKNSIPQMISKVKEGKFEEAYRIDKETNPLGAICGLICPHERQCQGSCVRGIKEKPVSIGKIENYICEKFIDNKINYNDVQNNNDKKVAIIGGGPAGISCAYFLAKNGIPSTIFEKEEYLRRNFKIWNPRI